MVGFWGECARKVKRLVCLGDDKVKKSLYQGRKWVDGGLGRGRVSETGLDAHTELFRIKTRSLLTREGAQSLAGSVPDLCQFRGH